MQLVPVPYAIHPSQNAPAAPAPALVLQPEQSTLLLPSRASAYAPASSIFIPAPMAATEHMAGLSPLTQLMPMSLASSPYSPRPQPSHAPEDYLLAVNPALAPFIEPQRATPLPPAPAAVSSTMLPIAMPIADLTPALAPSIELRTATSLPLAPADVPSTLVPAVLYNTDFTPAPAPSIELQSAAILPPAPADVPPTSIPAALPNADFTPALAPSIELQTAASLPPAPADVPPTSIPAALPNAALTPALAASIELQGAATLPPAPADVSSTITPAAMLNADLVPALPPSIELQSAATLPLAPADVPPTITPAALPNADLIPALSPSIELQSTASLPLASADMPLAFVPAVLLSADDTPANVPTSAAASASSFLMPALMEGIGHISPPLSQSMPIDNHVTPSPASLPSMQIIRISFPGQSESFGSFAPAPVPATLTHMADTDYMPADASLTKLPGNSQLTPSPLPDMALSQFPDISPVGTSVDAAILSSTQSIALLLPPVPTLQPELAPLPELLPSNAAAPDTKLPPVNPQQLSSSPPHELPDPDPSQAIPVYPPAAHVEISLLPYSGPSGIPVGPKPPLTPSEYLGTPQSAEDSNASITAAMHWPSMSPRAELAPASSLARPPEASSSIFRCQYGSFPLLYHYTHHCDDRHQADFNIHCRSCPEPCALTDLAWSSTLLSTSCLRHRVFKPIQQHQRCEQSLYITSSYQTCAELAASTHSRSCFQLSNTAYTTASTSRGPRGSSPSPSACV